MYRYGNLRPGFIPQDCSSDTVTGNLAFSPLNGLTRGLVMTTGTTSGIHVELRSSPLKDLRSGPGIRQLDK